MGRGNRSAEKLEYGEITRQTKDKYETNFKRFFENKYLPIANRKIRYIDEEILESLLGVLVADVAQFGEVHAAVFVIVPHQTARAVPHGHRAFGSREEVQNRKAQFRIRRLRADRPDAVAAQRGQTVDDGVRFVRHTRIHHLAFTQMLVRVVDHGGGIVEDAPEHAAVLDFLAHFVVGLRHGVRVKQAGAIELVEEAQHLDVRAVFIQRIVEFAIRGVVQTKAEFVIAIVRRSRFGKGYRL